MSPLRWTCKSLRQLSAQLKTMGHTTNRTTVGELLHTLGFSLQANAKNREGGTHIDRDAQFCHINATVTKMSQAGQPVISVDTKKKELVGDFKNNGQEWRPKGQPEEVRVHDFIIPELGKANPYGVYDLVHNNGWVSVGTDHDTSAFAVATIRRWWESMGREAYPEATELLITADGGGSNGSRVRLWKLELKKFAEETGLRVSVCHFPPGTSKWNKIEHRLFSFISMNWRGRPLTSHEVMIELIAATTNQGGLKVRSEIDRTEYPLGVKITKKQMDALEIDRDEFHGEWNYHLSPKNSDQM